MTERSDNISPVVRKLATATCLVALLPIGMGALVTTLKAGMAFADWPSSDGRNMLLYPWFSDFRSSPDKFVEHGHRLAGVVIGLLSVALAITGWLSGPARIRRMTLLILAAVIMQGLLGGFRVLFDRQLLALTHSVTGAVFFTLCLAFRLSCSVRWTEWSRQQDRRITPVMFGIVLLAPVCVLGQYVLGGMLRHLHTMLTEHLAGAVITGFICAAASVSLLQAEHALLKRCGAAVAAALAVQIFLGFAAFLTRFGFASIGLVAESGSLLQTVSCSSHTVCGMFLLGSTFLSAGSMVVLYRQGCLPGLSFDLTVIRSREHVA